MSLTTEKPKKGGDFKIVPDGIHVVRCVRVIDLGVQSFTYNGETKSAPKVQISYEFPNERITIEGEDLPMMLSREFTKSLHEKATLRSFLKNWRGKDFTEEELEGFDIRKLLSAPAMLTVVHESGTGANSAKTYANISAISKLPAEFPKGTKIVCPPQETPSLFYEIEMGKNEVFSSLPDWIQKKIMASKEFVNGEVITDGPGKIEVPPPSQDNDDPNDTGYSGRDDDQTLPF